VTERLERLAKETVAELWSALGVVVQISSDLDYRHCRGCGLRFFSPLITGDQAFYEELQRFSWYYLEEKPEYDLAMSYLPKTGSILEIGAGKGAFAKHLTSHEYVGLEFSEQAIRFAKERGIHLIAESVEDFARAHPGSSFSVVCAFQVLEHVADPHSFLESAVRLLAEEGRLIIAVPAHDSYLGWVVDSPLNLPPHHVTHWSNETLRAVGSIFGLRLLALVNEELSPTHTRSARKARWSRYLRALCGIRRNSLISRNHAERTLERVAAVFGRWIPSPHLDTRGHTVLAIFERP
jgi:SAM-dependent methyltransferase